MGRQSQVSFPPLSLWLTMRDYAGPLLGLTGLAVNHSLGPAPSACLASMVITGVPQQHKPITIAHMQHMLHIYLAWIHHTLHIISHLLPNHHQCINSLN